MKVMLFLYSTFIMQISLLGCNSLREQLLAAVSAELNCTDGPIKFIPTQAICKYEEPNSFADFFEILKFHRNEIGLKEKDVLRNEIMEI